MVLTMSGRQLAVTAAPTTSNLFARDSCTSFNITTFEGQPIFCIAGSPSLPQNAISRLSSGTLRWYPNPSIAGSWDPSYGNYLSIDCTGLTRGPNMSSKPANGQAFSCDVNSGNPFSDPGAIYRYDGAGVLNWYPNQAIASEWDSNYASPVHINCTGFTAGPVMTIKNVQQNLGNGQGVKCSGNAPPGLAVPAGNVVDAVSRYSNGFLRWYPNPTIASSWDSNWMNNFITIDCTGLGLGPNMAMKTRANF